MIKIPKTREARLRRLHKVGEALLKLRDEQRELLKTLNLCDHGREKDTYCRSCLVARGFSPADLGY